MPKDLIEVHKKIDEYVDSIFKYDGFKNDEERLEHLMNLYLNIMG